jgi:hypothetical protein
MAYSINRQPSRVNNSSPFELFYNRYDHLLKRSPNLETFPEESWITHLKTMRDIIYDAITEKTSDTREKSAKELDLKRKIAPLELFKVGAKVMLKNLRPCSKAESKYLGPYTILEVTSDKQFRIADESLTGKPLLAAAHQLKPLREPLKTGEGDIFQVEEILDYKKLNGEEFYLIKWKNYESLEWIPSTDFITKDLILEFHKRNYKKQKIN